MSESEALADGAAGNAPPVGGGGDGIEEACTLPMFSVKCKLEYCRRFDADEGLYGTLYQLLGVSYGNCIGEK